MRRLTVLLVCLASCSQEASKRPRASGDLIINAPDAAPGDAGVLPTVTGPERMIEGRYYVRAGAPEPLVCGKDRDCIGDTVTDETGCCVRTPESYPQTWGWHTWVTQRRLSQDCDKVTCPPLPVAGMPKACRLDVKCVSGKCADSCSEKPEEQQDAGQKQAPKKE